MKTYSYWDNKKGYHATLLFECVASNILEADALLKDALGIIAMKEATISLTSTGPLISIS